MTIHFIGAGPGAPDLITVRGRDLLARCPVCLYAGSLVAPAVLSHCRADARRVDTAALALDDIIAIMAEADAQGLDVARLHSGDLSIWSAVGEQIRRLDAIGIPWSWTPGVPAFAAAAAALGRELTLPEVAQSVVLTRTPGRASAMPAAERLEGFAATGATLAVHLSAHALARVADAVREAQGADAPMSVVYRASWPDQRIVAGTAADIMDRIAADGAEQAVRGGDPIDRTALIIAGPVLTATDFANSALYDAGYRRRYRGGGGDS